LTIWVAIVVLSAFAYDDPRLAELAAALGERAPRFEPPVRRHHVTAADVVEILREDDQ